MENSSNIFSIKILNYLKIAAHWAMFTIAVIVARLCFTIYYIFNYYKSLNVDTELGKHTISYFSNSAADIILSLLSAYFLYMFTQYTYQAIKNNHPTEWEGVFAHFRNYLIMGIILSLNWMLFSLINMLSYW